MREDKGQYLELLLTVREGRMEVERQHLVLLLAVWKTVRVEEGMYSELLLTV